MKILLNEKEKLDLIYNILCSTSYYYEENNCLRHADEKEYKISKKAVNKVGTPREDSDTICYEDVLMSLLKNGYDIMLVDDYYWNYEDEVKVLGRYNLQEILDNLDNLPLDDNYYSSEESVTKDILNYINGNYDSLETTRLSSILFPLNEATRK